MVQYNGLTQREGGESVLEQIERCSLHCVRWQLVPQVDDTREEGVLVGVSYSQKIQLRSLLHEKVYFQLNFVSVVHGSIT